MPKNWRCSKRLITANLYSARAARRCGPDHPLELPFADGVLETGPCPGMWQHRRPQTGRTNAPHSLASWRTDASTASQKFRRSLETGRRPLVGPVKSAVGGVVVVGNKGQDAGAQLLHGEATESGKQATDEDAEPDLNLVEPGTVSGSIHEANAMSRVGEKGGARAHAGEMTTFAFDAQVFLYFTLRSYQTHQRFRLMGVQLISDKDPGGVRISLEGLDEVSGKVGFGARGSNAGSDDLSSGHL